MSLFGKSISIAIVLIMLISVVAVDASDTESLGTGNITEHSPQSRVLEEEEIPNSGGTPWLWIFLGAVVVIAGIAAAAGSSGDSTSTRPISSCKGSIR